MEEALPANMMDYMIDISITLMIVSLICFLYFWLISIIIWGNNQLRVYKKAADGSRERPEITPDQASVNELHKSPEAQAEETGKEAIKKAS